MNHHQTIKTDSRRPTGQLSIEHATLHNLRDVSVSIPEGVLTVVTGVAGSGKSSLIHGCLPERYPDAVFIDQNLPAGRNGPTPPPTPACST
ncbi:hypothetical protein [Streptosporangium canum]|uniref:hypothetical protein n=1 Tax=Streptosporangium canum TaxID=324952 RepID=UPI00379F88D1